LKQLRRREYGELHRRVYLNIRGLRDIRQIV
jgi:hypothetical protein